MGDEGQENMLAYWCDRDTESSLMSNPSRHRKLAVCSEQ